MMLRHVLRLTVVALAVAGVADPVVTREIAVRPQLSIVALDPALLAVAQGLRERVAGDYESAIRLHTISRAAACPAAGGCVLVSSGWVPQRVTAGAALIGALQADVDDHPILAGIDVPPRVHLSAASRVRVRLTKPAHQVEVFDDGVLVGFMAEAQSGAVDVPWTPVAAGPRRLRVVADADAADVGVRVVGERAAIVFYEPETSWSGTFVRRALTDDGRFDLRARTEVASSIAVSFGPSARLDARSIADADVVVVSAPHLLTGTQVSLLERFVARRGGSVIMLPDRRPTGPVLRLLPPIADARHETPPLASGRLEAADVLSFEESPAVTVVQRLAERAVIISNPIGRGRVIVSGAMDAWRYRDADRGFETFWTSLTWEAATASGAALRVTAPALVKPGDEVPIAIDLQTMDELPADISAEGAFDCGGERGLLRLWPAARPGAFTAVLRPDAAGTCRVTASVAGASGVTDLLVASDVRAVGGSDARLHAAVAAHGGIVATAGHEDDLLFRIRERLQARHETRPTWPMRSPLWVLPFIACLGAEWWLRRRAGMA
jgi:hypothetical protein